MHKRYTHIIRSELKCKPHENTACPYMGKFKNGEMEDWTQMKMELVFLRCLLEFALSNVYINNY